MKWRLINALCNGLLCLILGCLWCDFSHSICNITLISPLFFINIQYLIIFYIWSKVIVIWNYLLFWNLLINANKLLDFILIILRLRWLVINKLSKRIRLVIFKHIWLIIVVCNILILKWKLNHFIVYFFLFDNLFRRTIVLIVQFLLKILIKFIFPFF